MNKKKNEHTYETTTDFEAWWETMTDEPHKATMEKLCAWKAWEERGKRMPNTSHPNQSDLLQ